MIRIHLIFYLLFLFGGCKLKSRKVVEAYNNGKPKIEHIYPNKNDTTTYTYQVYYRDGKLMYTGKVIKGKYVDEKKAYYPDGKIERIEKLFYPVTLNDSLYDCQVFNYWNNGLIESSYTYKNNKLNGTEFDYDSLGRLVRTDDYINGKLDGKEIHFFPSGKVRELEYVKNDSAYGFAYDFNEAGDTTSAIVHYGFSIKGVFCKRWLQKNLIQTGSYGDSKRSFVIWKWINKDNRVIKKLVDHGKNGVYTPPLY